VKTIDLRRQQLTLDELLRSVGGDVVRLTSKDGEEFILEAADSFDREAKELGRSAKFLAFLAERSAESGRVALAEIEARVARAEPSTTASSGIAAPEEDPSSPPSVPDA
jgi:hypothetical protein